MVDLSVPFLERPELVGDRFDALADVRELCERTAPGGAVVVDDESNATCFREGALVRKVRFPVSSG
jgi:hypothetical protein